MASWWSSVCLLNFRLTRRVSHSLSFRRRAAAHARGRGRQGCLGCRLPWPVSAAAASGSLPVPVPTASTRCALPCGQADASPLRRLPENRRVLRQPVGERAGNRRAIACITNRIGEQIGSRQAYETAHAAPAGRPRRPETVRAASAAIEALAASGARARFYEGALARRICGALGPAGSPLSRKTLAPTTPRGSGRSPPATVVSRSPGCRRGTQGLAALQILNLLEGFDVAAWGKARSTTTIASSGGGGGLRRPGRVVNGSRVRQYSARAATLERRMPPSVGP